MLCPEVEDEVFDDTLDEDELDYGENDGSLSGLIERNI